MSDLALDIRSTNRFMPPVVAEDEHDRVLEQSVPLQPYKPTLHLDI